MNNTTYNQNMTHMEELGKQAAEAAFDASRLARAVGERIVVIEGKRRTLAGFPGTVIGVSLAYDHAEAAFEQRSADRRMELFSGVSVLALGKACRKELTP